MVHISRENIAEIGKVILFHRKKAGLSRIALAEAADVGKTVIYDIEHGKRSVRLNTLMNIFNVLNISLNLESPIMGLFEGEKDTKNAQDA